MQTVMTPKEFCLSVPLMSGDVDTPEKREKALVQLRRCGAQRVFLVGSVYQAPHLQDQVFAHLEENFRFFKIHGFEVGTWWLTTVVRDACDISFQVNDLGEQKSNWRCPADERLIALQETYARRVAALGVDLMMFDDDFHLCHAKNGNIRGCFCEHHKKLFEEMFGTEIPFQTAVEHFWEDTPNPYRQMLLQCMGASLERFARRIRAAADEVNPKVRIGFCVNDGDYYVNGTDVQALAKCLAGNTRPFVRLIGAPYWDYFCDYPQRLASTMELERAQMALLKDSGIETMCEGDVFPRPRYATPASILECFDLVMRADGNGDGILKYMLDYYSPADYETGYVDAHVENQALYKEVAESFSNGCAAGVRVYHFPEKYGESRPRYAPATNSRAGDYTLSITPVEGDLLTQLSIPTTYEGRGCAGVAFGENAAYLDEEALNRGIITDAIGARVLQDKGIDVGLKHFDGQMKVTVESFGDGVKHAISGGDQGYCMLSVDEKAQVLSWYAEKEEGKPAFSYGPNLVCKYPAAYLYENAAGQRFYVLAMVAKKSVAAVRSLRESYRSYGKAKQLAYACQWVGRKPLPVQCPGHPDLYILCKETQEGLAVGLWNLSKDKIRKPEVLLGEASDVIRYINCTGTAVGDTVTLSTLYPYEFCGFVVKK